MERLGTFEPFYNLPQGAKKESLLIFIVPNTRAESSGKEAYIRVNCTLSHANF